MTLTEKERCILEYFYLHPADRPSVPEIYRKLKLESGDEAEVEEKLSEEMLIRRVLTTAGGVYYKITPHGKAFFSRFTQPIEE